VAQQPGAPPTAQPGAAAAATPRPPAKRYAAEDFFRTVSYAGASFSPDGGKLLVSSNATGVFNAYVVPVAGGEPRPLTASTTDAIRVAGYFPRDERFVYTKDQGGNELTHVHVREASGAERDLTPGSGFKADFGGWMRDGRSFLVLTNERDRQSFDLSEIAVDGYAKTLLFRNPGGFLPGPVSPDRRYVALVKMRTTSDADVWLHDRQTGATTNLTAHEGAVANSPAAFTPDGSALLLLTDAGSEFAHLVRHDLATGRRTTLLEPRWDVAFADFSWTGRYLVVGVNADARTDLRVYAWPGMRQVPLPAVPDAEISSVTFSRDDRRIAFYASAPRSPRDVYVASLAGGAGAGAPRRLTRSLNPAIDPAELVDARVARFRSYDGVEVPGVLYLPHGASPSARVPGVVMVHGGPGGQARVGWNPLVQLLVNHGYAVYDVNNRGSSGYGKTFYALDDRRPRRGGPRRRRGEQGAARQHRRGRHRAGGGGRRKLRRLHDARRADDAPRRVRRGRRHLRRVELAAHAAQHPALVGRPARGAVRRAGRPERRRLGAVAAHLAAVQRGAHPPAAPRPAGRQRPARAPDRERRDRRRRTPKRRPRSSTWSSPTRGTASRSATTR
jgi:dipeptidyl aminopeptidase/acylaminoacyl peptidase